MKYIFWLLVCLLVLWAVSLPFVRKAQPGSLSYKFHVTVNEPIWVWVHITHQGRGLAVEEYYEKRLEEFQKALLVQSSREYKAVALAEARSVDRLLVELRGSVRDTDFVVAYKLATHALFASMTHHQALLSLGKSQPSEQMKVAQELAKTRQADFLDIYEEVKEKFLISNVRVDLVKAIDNTLFSLEQDFVLVDDLKERVSLGFTDTQRTAFSGLIKTAEKTRKEAADKLAIDNYTSAYIAAIDASAYLLSARLAMRQSEYLGVPVVPVILPE